MRWPAAVGTHLGDRPPSTLLTLLLGQLCCHWGLKSLSLGSLVLEAPESGYRDSNIFLEMKIYCP